MGADAVREKLPTCPWPHTLRDGLLHLLETHARADEPLAAVAQLADQRHSAGGSAGVVATLGQRHCPAVVGLLSNEREHLPRGSRRADAAVSAKRAFHHPPACLSCAGAIRGSVSSRPFAHLVGRTR